MYANYLIIVLNLFIIGYLTPLTNSWLCGRILGKANLDRIVGGWDEGYYKYPWYAALIQDDDDFVYCGGTLIAPNYVVTAAHCYREFLKKNHNLEKGYDVRLGINNRCLNESTQKTFKVEKVFIHEEYLERDPYFDIALLHLIGDTSDYMPCCLPKHALTSQTRGKEGFIAGLGNLKYQATKPPCTLHEARVKIYTDEACRHMLDEAENEGNLLINGVCAGYLEGGIDACQGDSGGPLMIQGTYGESVLLGLTSFGYKCADKDVLGMYTDVSHYIDWMQRKSSLKLIDATPIENVTTPPPIDVTSSGSGDDDDNDSDNDNDSDVDNDSDDGNDSDVDNDSDDSTNSGVVIPIYPPVYSPHIVIHIHKKHKKKHKGKHPILHHLLTKIRSNKRNRNLDKSIHHEIKQKGSKINHKNGNKRVHKSGKRRNYEKGNKRNHKEGKKQH